MEENKNDNLKSANLEEVSPLFGIITSVEGATGAASTYTSEDSWYTQDDE